MRRARLALAGLVVAGLAACGGEHYEPGEIADQDEAEGFVRIRYGSVDVEGDDSTVGGLVAVPAGTPPADGWPIVAYAHGTTGNADGCAPSGDPTLAGTGAALQTLAAAGFVAVATDYEGIGTSGPHPYLNGPSEARAVVDSVRAAQAVVPEAGTRWAVLGYSQGGHASLWTAQLGAELAPELQLLGAAALAPVTETAELIAVGGPHLTALVIDGWIASTPDLDEDEVLTESGRDAAEAAEDECTVAPSDATLLTDAGAEPFAAYLATNDVGRAPATVPVLVAQGDRDQLVHADVTQRAVERLCAAGSTVAVREYDADHLTIVDKATPDAIAWLADRFAGGQPPSSC